MSESLTKWERLRGRATIRDRFGQGSPVSCRGSKLLVSPNSLSWNRILLVPTRKYAGSVVRNRAKRVGREAFRREKARMKQGFDLIWILYPGSDTLLERSNQLRILCKRADLFSERAHTVKQ
ncbi:MAG: ribonuclease P protein component [Spirochaetales bacterium]